MYGGTFLEPLDVSQNVSQKQSPGVSQVTHKSTPTNHSKYLPGTARLGSFWEASRAQIWVNSLEKPIEVEDLKVDPLAKMKTTCDRKVEFGRWILGSWSEGNHTNTHRNLIISIFTFSDDFEWITKYCAFAWKWESEYKHRSSAKKDVFVNNSMISKGGKVNISNDA